MAKGVGWEGKGNHCWKLGISRLLQFLTEYVNTEAAAWQPACVRQRREWTLASQEIVGAVGELTSEMHRGSFPAVVAFHPHSIPCCVSTPNIVAMVTCVRQRVTLTGAGSGR